MRAGTNHFVLRKIRYIMGEEIDDTMSSKYKIGG